MGKMKKHFVGATAVVKEVPWYRRWEKNSYVFTIFFFRFLRNTGDGKTDGANWF